MRFSALFSLVAVPALLLGLAADVSAQRSGDDRLLARHVAIELRLSDGVPAGRIGVQVSDGVVTLTGTAEDGLARHRAVRAARSVPGVRRVVSRIAISGVGRSDRQVETDVEATLGREPELRLDNLDASVQNGVVTLTGTVESLTEARQAGRVAAQVPGVRDVRNLVQVEDRPGVRPEGGVPAPVAMFFFIPS